MDKKTLIEASLWEKMQKASFQEVHVPLQEAITSGDKKGYEFDPFTQDIFSALYQMEPKFPEQASAGRQWQKSALDSMQQLPEYKTVRDCGTVCDSFQSGLGATVIAQHFAEALSKKEEPNPDDIDQEIENYQEILKEFPKGNKSKKFEGKVKELQAAREASVAEWADNMSEQQVRTAMRHALQAAQQEINDLDSSARAFGYGTDPGSDGYTDARVKIEVAKRIRDNKKLQEIAKLAGRFRAEARAIQSQKKSPGFDEITEIETGADIGRLLPVEMTKLNHPLMKLDFAKKFLEKSLLQYKLEAVEKKARGPIVFCLDNSGSMSGEKEVWSKAISLALCEIATKEKRTFEIIHFDTVVQRKDVFVAGKTDPLKLIESMSYFSGGGTNFSVPLAEAFKDIVQAATKDLNNADVIFITDDAGDLPEKAVLAISTAKKYTGAKLYTICLGAQCRCLAQLSDMITNISDLSDDETVDSVKETIFSI